MRDADLVIIIKGEYAGRRGVIAERRSPHFKGEKDAVWIGSPPTIVGLTEDAMILDSEAQTAGPAIERRVIAPAARPARARLSLARVASLRLKALTLIVAFR